MRCLRQQPQTATHRVRLGAPESWGGGLAAPKQGEPCHRVPPSPGAGVRGAALPQAGSAFPSPSPSPSPSRGARLPRPPSPRPQRRPRCDARGEEAAARAFAWAEGKAASPVCFIFSWQLRTAQRSSAPPAGRAGRQPREDRAGRAGGRTGTGGERLPQASCSQPGCEAPPPPAPAPAAASRERQGQTGSGLRRPLAAAAARPGLATRCLASPPPQPRRAGALQMASPGLELGEVQPPAEPPQPELAFTEAQKWIEVSPRDGRGTGAWPHRGRPAGQPGVLPFPPTVTVPPRLWVFYSTLISMTASPPLSPAFLAAGKAAGADRAAAQPPRRVRAFGWAPAPLPPLPNLIC